MPQADAVSEERERERETVKRTVGRERDAGSAT